MVSTWRNFKNIFSKPLFTIIFRPEMLKFHPYSILTGDTMVGYVIFYVLSLKLLNQYGHRTTLPICIDFFDGFRSCRDDGRYQDGLIKTSKIIVIKIRKTRERIGRYSLTRLGSLSINAQNFGVNTCKFYKKINNFLQKIQKHQFLQNE